MCNRRGVWERWLTWVAIGAAAAQLLIPMRSGLIPVTGALPPDTPGFVQSWEGRGPSSLNPISRLLTDAPLMRGDAPAALYAPSALALRVVQQPPARPGFVSGERGVATQFGLASQYGSLGFLAHNTSSGARFSYLHEGQEIWVIRGGGDMVRYRVTEILRFQALTPTSPYSDFLGLTPEGERYTSTELFNLIYGQEGALVLQTCIERDGDPNWGRLFVIARPVGDA